MQTSKSKIVKLFLVIVSIFQSYSSMAVLAGGAVAATKFGDKSYLIQMRDESDKLLEQGRYEELIEMTKPLIEEFYQYSKTNESKGFDRLIERLNYNMAVSMEKCDYPKSEIVDKFIESYGMETKLDVLIWMNDNADDVEFKSLINKEFEISDMRHLVLLLKKQEDRDSNYDWNLLKKMLDIILDTDNEKKLLKNYKLVNNTMRLYHSLNDKYEAYLESHKNYDLIFYVREYEKFRKSFEMKDISKAKQILDKISSIDLTPQQKAKVDFDNCRCLFQSGQYFKTIEMLDEYINNNKELNRELNSEAIMLKGRCYIQLGEHDKARDVFTDLIIEFPDSLYAPQASFLIGYSHSLSGNYGQAKTALELVIQQFADSGFAKKAKMCLSKIESLEGK